MQPARIFVVDDHPLVRRGLRQLIEDEPDLMVCCESGSIAETLQSIEHCIPDLLIIDISLPDGNGLDLVKRLLARDPGIRILVSSMHDEELFAQRALRAGAKGYLNKQEAAERVLDAVRQILKGKMYVSQRMTERLLQDVAANAPRSSRSPIERLSDRELEVFELIGRGQGASEIANKLNLSVKTIETHRANIKRKLNLASANELTRSAVQWSLENN